MELFKKNIFFWQLIIINNIKTKKKIRILKIQIYIY